MAHELMKRVQVAAGALDVFERLGHRTDRLDRVVADPVRDAGPGRPRDPPARSPGRDTPLRHAAIACARQVRRDSTSGVRNPHAGQPFTTPDEEIAEALLDVSIPTLMLSLVHMSGDAEVIRGDLKPAGLFLNEVQGYMSEEDKAAVRKIALEVIADYRDRGCPEPEPISAELLHEMMKWLVCEPVPDEYVPMLLEEMELDGRDARLVPPAGEADDFPVVVIGCGESGLLAGIRLKEAGIPFTIVEKNAGVGGTWYQNTYPGRAGRRTQPLLLLQLRADRSVDALLRRTARAAGVFRARDGQARHPPPCAVGNRGHRGVLGRRHRDVDRSHPRPQRNDDRTVGACGDHRGGAARPSAHPDDRGTAGLRRADIPLQRVGSLR